MLKTKISLQLSHNLNLFQDVWQWGQGKINPVRMTGTPYKQTDMYPLQSFHHIQLTYCLSEKRTSSINFNFDLWSMKFSLNIFIYSGLGNKYITGNPFPLCGCECCLVAALAYSFSKSTRVSFTCKRYGSLLTRVSHLSSPSDGLSSFPQDHTRKWCQGRNEVEVR